MQTVTAILLALAVFLCAAAAFGYPSLWIVQTFPAGVAVYLASLLLARLN